MKNHSINDRFVLFLTTDLQITAPHGLTVGSIAKS